MRAPLLQVGDASMPYSSVTFYGMGESTMPLVLNHDPAGAAGIGRLVVQAGAVDQVSPLQFSGAIDFIAPTVSLQSDSNIFGGPVGFYGDTLSLESLAPGGLILGNVSANSLVSLFTYGDITQAPGTALLTPLLGAMSQAGSILLGNPGNSLSQLSLGAGGAINLMSSGALTLGGAESIFAYGPVTIGSLGTLAVSSDFSLPYSSLTLSGNAVLIGAPVDGYNVTIVGNTVNIVADVSATQDVSLVSFGALTISSGASISAGNDVILAGSTIGMTGGSRVEAARDFYALAGTLTMEGSGLWSWRDGYVKATSITLRGGSSIFPDGDLSLIADNVLVNMSSLDTWYGDIKAKITNDFTLSGSIVSAGNDVYLEFLKPNSNLYINSKTTYPSYVESNWYAGVGQTTYLQFLTRASGGIWIDGIETTTTLDGGSGFYHYVGSSRMPALPGSGLFLAYVAAQSQNICSIAPDACKPPPSPTGVLPAGTDACALDPRLCSLQPSGPGQGIITGGDTIGGEEGEFGEKKDEEGEVPEGGAKPDDKARGKRVALCRV